MSENHAEKVAKEVVARNVASMEIVSSSVCQVCDKRFEYPFNSPKRFICDDCKRKLKFYVDHGSGYKCKDDAEKE